jgi:hypothetical protein
MIQGGGGPRFALESLQRLRIAGQFLGKDLQRDVAVSLRSSASYTTPMLPPSFRRMRQGEMVSPIIVPSLR